MPPGGGVCEYCTHHFRGHWTTDMACLVGGALLLYTTHRLFQKSLSRCMEGVMMHWFRRMCYLQEHMCMHLSMQHRPMDSEHTAKTILGIGLGVECSNKMHVEHGGHCIVRWSLQLSNYQISHICNVYSQLDRIGMEGWTGWSITPHTHYSAVYKGQGCIWSCSTQHTTKWRRMWVLHSSLQGTFNYRHGILSWRKDLYCTQHTIFVKSFVKVRRCVE